MNGGGGGGGSRGGIQKGGQGLDGRVLEKGDNRQGAGELLTDGLMDAEHEEGVAAEVKEVVRGADGGEAEGALPKDGEAVLHGSARRGGVEG